MPRGHRFLPLTVSLLVVATVCHADDGASGGYPFAAPPARALELIGGLGPAAPTDDEKSLFAAAKGGRLGMWTFAEVALVASGVTDPSKRRGYLARIDALEAQARQANGRATTPRERGARLLQFLHDGPMAKGYVSDQMLLDAVLDTGKYNCMSSTVLYAVLARRLGLEARAVEVPGHVYAVLYVDGKPVDVETTSAHGFDPANPEEREKLRKEKGIVVLESGHGDRGREVRELGLAAAVYANRSAALAGAKRYHEAAVAGFCALSLDPESPAAATNAVAALTNWTLALADDGKYEEAVRVARAGLATGPRDDSSLRNNRKVVWGKWADRLVRDGKEDDAVAMLRRAAAEVRAEDRDDVLDLQAQVYVQQGEALIRAADWEKALRCADRGLKKADQEAEEKLRRWRNGVYLRWAAAEEKTGNAGRAVAVLERAMTTDPTESDFSNNLGCLVRDRAVWLHTAGKPTEAKAELLRMQKRFPKCDDVQRAGRGAVQQLLQGPVARAKYDEAIKIVDGYAEAIPNPSDFEELVSHVYSEEAKPFMDKEDWPGATIVFEKGVKKYPGNRALTHNLEVCRGRSKK
jgi:tetratricopeptide (TPR) repeat protein